MRNPENYCVPANVMSSSNVYDAKKECDSIPNCDRFYDNRGSGKHFYACENTAVGYESTEDSIMYHALLGNKNIRSINILKIYHKHFILIGSKFQNIVICICRY